MNHRGDPGQQPKKHQQQHAIDRRPLKNPRISTPPNPNPQASQLVETAIDEQIASEPSRARKEERAARFLAMQRGALEVHVWGGGGGGKVGSVCPALRCGAFWSGPKAVMGRCGGEVLGLMGRILMGWMDREGNGREKRGKGGKRRKGKGRKGKGR